jgi:hypothetical protein
MSPRDIALSIPSYIEEEGDEAREDRIHQEEIDAFPQVKRNEIKRTLFEHRLSYRKYIEDCLTVVHARKNRHYTFDAYMFLFENPIMEEMMSNVDEIINEDIEAFYDYTPEDIFYYNVEEPLVIQFRSNPFTEFLNELIYYQR